ncbi:MAG: spore cortex biosynthesis protein YabQ [Lachnospiraceae bacterium]|nr:spore cortex biosynthesis protein YabQ [Lachnospiraceae bacterium]
MAGLLYDELTLFGICFLLGVALAVVYDLVRIFRLLVPHMDIIVDLEDLAFWLFTAWMVFGTLFKYNQGALRGYAFIGMFAGVIIYALTLSRLIMYMVRKLVPYWKKCFSGIFKPFKQFAGFLRKELKNAKDEFTIALKGR